MTNILLIRFVKGMVDAMNAEISLGTVATAHDAVRWLGYTYLFVRMQKTPLIYGELPPRNCLPRSLKWHEGIPYNEVQDDPLLSRKRYQLVRTAAGSLAEARMINHDKDRDSFTITDLGRIAAKYYIHHRTIEIFNRELRTQMTEADVLSMVSLSTEVSDLASKL
jgi:antiviral helicase SLH1